MTNEKPQPLRVKAAPESRLEQLIASYDQLKAAADEAKDRADAVKAAIQAELLAHVTDPNTKQVVTDASRIGLAYKLSYVEAWRCDEKRLKAEDPKTYVKWAVKRGHWELRKVTS